MKTRKKTAKIEDILVSCGIPLVVLLKRNAGAGAGFYMATAIPDDDDEIDYYFTVSVSKLYLRQYLSGQCDLRYLYAFAPGRKFFTIAEMRNVGEKAELAEFEGVPEEYMLPSPQFFSSAHTSSYGIGEMANGEQLLKIDGDWQMPEFGQFYQKYADLYVFKTVMASASRDRNRFYDRVRSAFMSKPFKGGSSYYGLFSDLFDLVPTSQRPMLEGIEYHSPGQVQMRGDGEAFDLLKESIEHYLLNMDEIGFRHADLRKYMSSMKMLEIGGRSVSLTEGAERELFRLAARLYESMAVIPMSDVLELTNRNLVVSGKIGLALYRRLSAAGSFFAQGRMAFL